MPSFRRMASLIVCSFASGTDFFWAFLAAELGWSRTIGLELSVMSVCLGKQRSYRHYGTIFVGRTEFKPMDLIGFGSSAGGRVIWGFEKDVAVDADVEAIANRHLDRGLDVQ